MQVFGLRGQGIGEAALASLILFQADADTSWRIGLVRSRYLFVLDVTADQCVISRHGLSCLMWP